jgi:hypothetical protein
MVFTGWRAVFALAIGLAILIMLVVVALWVAIAIGVLGAVLWLNLVLLPRLARRLFVPVLALELACLPLFTGVGYLIGRPAGAALGCLAWLAGIGVPRLVRRRLRARVRHAVPGSGTVIVIDSPVERLPGR